MTKPQQPLELERSELKKRTTLLKYLHKFAYTFYHRLFISFSVIAVLFGTVSGSFMFYSFSTAAQPPDAIDVLVAVLDLLGACLNAVCLFLKPGMKAEKHLSISKTCQKLLLDMQTTPQDVTTLTAKVYEILEEIEPPSVAVAEFKRLCGRRNLSSDSFLYGDLQALDNTNV